MEITFQIGTFDQFLFMGVGSATGSLETGPHKTLLVRVSFSALPLPPPKMTLLAPIQNFGFAGFFTSVRAQWTLASSIGLCIG